MKIKISVPEVVRIFKGIQRQRGKVFEMVRTEIRENVGPYLSMIPARRIGRKISAGEVSNPQ